MRTSYKITCGALLVLLAMAIQPATALPGAAVGAPGPAAQAVSLGGADVGSQQSLHPEPAASLDNGDSATSLQAQSKVIVGYYPDWVTRSMQAEQIPYEKVTHINYAFAILTDSYGIKFDTDWLLPRVVTQAHSKGTKVLISVGGWTGSRYFSPMVASAANRKTFIDNVVAFLTTYKLDGVDIDWEYPGRLGMACNTFDAQHDTANFLTLLKELRARLDTEFGTTAAKRKQITLAVRVEPFDGPTGPIGNAADFAPYVDFVNAMAYDVYGSWSGTTGPNAPFNAAGESNWSFTQTVDSWLKAQFPKHKLVMGTAFYGRSAITDGKMSDNQFVAKKKGTPRGDQDDALWAEPCPGSDMVYSGVWQWRNLRSQGALVATDKAGPGWTRHWDQTTQTPWLFRDADNTFVSYDDPQSLAIKTDYVKKKDLGGVMLWDLHHDNGELLDVLQAVRN